MPSPNRTEADITTGLMAMIAWGGNALAASRSLKAQGKMNIAAPTLTSWAKERYPQRYQELREKYAPQLEAQLAHEFRDVAMLAVEVERLALEKAKTRLKAGDDMDPSRTAANSATVADKMSSKLLALTGRPTSIREDRSAEEIIRRLVQSGIIALPAGKEEGNGDGESG